MDLDDDGKSDIWCVDANDNHIIDSEDTWHVNVKLYFKYWSFKCRFINGDWYCNISLTIDQIRGTIIINSTEDKFEISLEYFVDQFNNYYGSDFNKIQEIIYKRINIT